MSTDKFPHGRKGYDKRGCHCANCEYRRAQPGYDDKGCRCEECKADHNEKISEQRDRRRARANGATRATGRPERHEGASSRVPLRPLVRAAQQATIPLKSPSQSVTRATSTVAPAVAPDVAPASFREPAGTPQWVMPHLWSVNEPSYAADHRKYLSAKIAKAISDPENGYYISFTSETTKQELKDFNRLIIAFKKQNPDLIFVESDNLVPWSWGAYREYTIYSAAQTENSDDIEEENTDANLLGTPIQRIVVPIKQPQSNNTSRNVKPQIKSPAKPTLRFDKAPAPTGMCEFLDLNTMEACHNGIDGNFTYNDGKIKMKICQDHHHLIQQFKPQYLHYVDPMSRY